MIKKKTLIIAEIGVNHNGSIKLAKEMILSATKAGADVVKFQLYKTNELIVKNTSLAKYQKKNTSFISQYEMLQKYELKYELAKKLIKFCKEKKIKIAFSVFNESYVKIFKNSNTDFIKIPSGEINNFFLLKEILKLKNKKIIISTGMSTNLEISKTLKFLQKNKTFEISLLHCISSYPTKITDINLKSISLLKEKFKKETGLSDHTISTKIPSYAVIAGASIIEKHFTLDKNMSGPDHKSSLNPKQFKQMVNHIRKAEIIYGYYCKERLQQENENKKFVRKVIVAKKKIKKTDKFTFSNLTAMRANYGISVGSIDIVIGKKSKKVFEAGEIIEI